MRKQNFKKYSKNAIASTIIQMENTCRPLSRRYSKDQQTIFDVCLAMLNDTTEENKAYFIKTFNKIIKYVNNYFITLPLYLKNEYKEFVWKKTQAWLYNCTNRITDFNLVTHLECLYKTYIRENILKDWTEFARKHPYLNPHYPYDVK